MPMTTDDTKAAIARQLVAENDGDHAAAFNDALRISRRRGMPEGRRLFWEDVADRIAYVMYTFPNA